jgi:prenyltransferase beta subunit
VRRASLAGLVLLILVPALAAQGQTRKKTTIEYLQNLQSADGGFRIDARAKESELPATIAAVRALKYFGGVPRDRAACIAFVEKCYDKGNGGFAARPGGKAAYRPTAIGIMGVVDLKMSTAPYADAVIRYLDEHSKTFEEIRLTAASFEALGKRPPHADDWLAEIARMRNADGTYGKGDSMARDTGGAVCAVLRLGGKVEHKDNVLRALNAGQRKDGGFGKTGVEGSDLETSYRVARAYHMLKSKPDGTDRLRRFIGRCRNEDGGYGVAPGQRSSVSGCYFAGIILHWLDEK